MAEEAEITSIKPKPPTKAFPCCLLSRFCFKVWNSALLRAMNNLPVLDLHNF